MYLKNVKPVHLIKTKCRNVAYFNTCVFSDLNNMSTPLLTEQIYIPHLISPHLHPCAHVRDGID